MKSSLDYLDRDELLSRWRKGGDRKALDLLLRYELAPIKRTLRKRLGHRARSPSFDTSDYVDEAVGRLLSLGEIPEFNDPTSFRAYLIRAALHLYINRYHSNRRRPLRVSTEDAPESLVAPSGANAVERQEFWDTVELALNLMDDDDAELLEWAVLKGRSIREIAEQLGDSKSSVARRLDRAKSNLMKTMLSWRHWVVS